MPHKSLTLAVPRFLSFIELSYLLEAIKVSNAIFQKQINALDNVSDRDTVRNINATRQSLLRSAFISAYAIFEQHLDEIVNMEANRQQCLLRPNDLKDRGITRSILFSRKVLGSKIDRGQQKWKDLSELQKVRNHLVHYGPGFNDSQLHKDKVKKFSEIEYISLCPMICFSFKQLETIFELLMNCVRDFNKSLYQK